MTDQSATELVSVAIKKKKPGLAFRRELTNRDAASLELYLCDGANARSTMGGMIDRAELFSQATARCWGCPEEPGIGKDGGWCPGCKGAGFISYDLTFSRRPDAEPINARPTAEVVQAVGYEPNHEVLQLYGRISRRFEAIAARAGRTHIEVLSDVHGDLGAKWARRREGRIFAVYPRTLAGRRLILKTCDERNPITLAPDERLRNLNDVQGRQPKKWRGELLEQAAQQAKKLYGDACAWWNFSAMLVRESPTESIARALRAAERPPEPIVLRDKHERFDLAARRPASEIFGKGKDGFAAMRRKAEEENEALDALDRRHA